EGVDKVPDLVVGQTPNSNFIAPNVDFKSYTDFRSPVQNHFIVHVTGFITAPREGSYEFRLTSDDGSIFWIRDTKVVDHDGLNSGTAVTGRFDMNLEAQPFFIEYFENGGDEVLKLEWKVPGSDTWEVVPESAFTTPSGEVKVTS